MDNKFVNGRDMNRTPLYTVVPMEIPFAIGIAPSDKCNFSCEFCSQSTPQGIKDARIISWDDFLEIANQIKVLVNKAGRKLKVLRFIGNGEPLLNRDTPEMIKYCVENDLAERYELTTNASMLTNDVSDRLINAGLTRLLISVEGMTPEKYWEVCKYKIDFEKFVKQIEYFYNHAKGKCITYIKIANVSINSEEEKQLFYSTFGHISDALSIENIIETTDGVDFSKFMSKEQRGLRRYNSTVGEKRICCDTLFMYMNIHSNGDVDTCGCLYPPHYIGNMFKKPIYELWNGEKHKELMIMHLSGRRDEIDVCAKCKSLELQGGFGEDNLDPYLDYVLNKINNINNMHDPMSRFSTN